MLGSKRSDFFPGIRSSVEFGVFVLQEYDHGEVGRPFENYLIFYRVTDEAVEIIRVLHGAMDFESIFSESAEN